MNEAMEKNEFPKKKGPIKNGPIKNFFIFIGSLAGLVGFISGVLGIYQFAKDNPKFFPSIIEKVQNLFPQENTETQMSEPDKKKDCEPSDPHPDCNKPSEQSK
ncbi:MAG: hypothetical protein VSS75_034715 [Candidatus Parabeggiatoa sp.]|nr:hypothetical protein [Candidatus Parabeggiatoa sp.]